MNDQQKIELGREIFNKVSIVLGLGLIPARSAQDCIDVSELAINKIQELEQKHREDEFLKGQKLGIPWKKVYKLTDKAQNNAEIVPPTTSPNKSTKYLLNGEKLHICGICYQSYPVHVLKINFQICHNCKSEGKIKIGVNDKNGQVFFSGDVLRAEDSLIAEVRILQIQPGTIVWCNVNHPDDFDCEPTQDFIDAGWIVHERVTAFKTEGTTCSTPCKFNDWYIGSHFCKEGCVSNKETNIDHQWIICEQYNKENESNTGDSNGI